MDRSIAGRFVAALIYVNSFVVGGVVMGFEMLGSRYLYPYFGGGIGTWAGLISTVLCALTIGYFAGGGISDRFGWSNVLASTTALASAYLVLVPLAADHVMSSILAVIGDGPSGILIAAAALLLFPLSFLGTFSPVAIRALVHSTSESGRVAGLVYGISTAGSIFGTLFTTFQLIPTIGSRSITYLYAFILAICAASLYVSRRIAPQSSITCVAVLFIVGIEVLPCYPSLGADLPRSVTAGTAPVNDTPLSGWDGARAMKDIEKQLSFGARSLNTPGHQAAIEFIKKQLSQTSATIGEQSWTQDNNGKRLTLTNIIARFDPANPRRIIAGTHYDSIVRAYRDPDHPDAEMPGANNSASGVALLLETARVLSERATPPPAGVDLVFFDGEEGPISLGAGDPNWKALGSPYFAAHIRDLYPDHLPLVGVIFDMVCYEKLKLAPEAISLAIAKNEVDEFWKIGSTLAPGIFQRSSAPLAVSDDQVALGAIGIPSFLVIGFDYEPWFNTTKDTIDKCSPHSLEAVGRTLLRYLYLTNFS